MSLSIVIFKNLMIHKRKWVNNSCVWYICCFYIWCSHIICSILDLISRHIEYLGALCYIVMWVSIAMWLITLGIFQFSRYHALPVLSLSLFLNRLSVIAVLPRKFWNLRISKSQDNIYLMLIITLSELLPWNMWSNIGDCYINDFKSSLFH